MRLGEVELLALDPSSGQPVARMVGCIWLRAEDSPATGPQAGLAALQHVRRPLVSRHSRKRSSSGNLQLNTLKSTGVWYRFLEIRSQIDFLEMA